MLKKISFGGLSLVALLPIAGAQAVESDPLSFVVTATRAAETADQTLASVTVITREEIEAKQATSLVDLLSGVSGLQIDNNGGPGKASSVYLRGTNKNHVLILVDGVRAGSVSKGEFPFGTFPVSQIEKIEIVRGPRSSLYGSEAIGGVIQIFTRRGSGDLKPHFRVGAGDHAHGIELGLAGSGDKGWLSANLSQQQDKGIDAQVGRNPDRDGFESESLSLRTGVHLNGHSTAELFFSRSDAESEYDGYYADRLYDAMSRTQVAGLTLNFEVSENWGLQLTVGQSHDRTKTYVNNLWDGGYYNTRRDSYSIQSNHYLGLASELIWGFDYQKDRLSSHQSYDINSRQNQGVFGLYQLHLGAHEVALSARSDDNEQYGRRDTGSIAWGLDLTERYRFTAGYATAFSAPTFNQLYYPDSSRYQSNADLKPETSESLEIGLSSRADQYNWSVNVYQTNIKNLIDGYTPVSNIGSARITGAEVVATADFSSWMFTGKLDLMNPVSLENDNQLLDRRARQKLTLSADHQYGDLSSGIDLVGVGKRVDQDGSEKLSGYGLVNLRSSYQLNPDWSVGAKLDNLFDKDYQTAFGYNQPGRTFWLSLNYAP